MFPHSARPFLIPAVFLAGATLAAAQARPPILPPSLPPQVLPGSGAVEELVPPDGVWLIEKETGYEYFEEAHYKDPNGYRRLPDGQVRLRWGLTVTPIREDDDFFYVKVYRPRAVDRPDSTIAATPEDLVEIAARYRGTAGTSDDLALEVLTSTLPTAGQWRNGFSVADVNGDGFLDIAHGPVRTGQGLPVFLLGDGTGNFKGWSAKFDLRHRLDYGDVTITDFDGDGRLDAAYACHLMGVMVLRNAGEGRFEPWSKGIEFNVPGRGGQGESFSSRAIASGDMNGDGRPDVVVLGEGPKLMGQISRRSIDGGAAEGADGSYGVRIYINNGDGSWSHGEDLMPHYAGDQILVTDLDGDGRLDVVIATIMVAHQPFVMLQRSPGVFEPLDLGFAKAGVVKAVAVADLDANGRPDLVLARHVRELDGWHGTLEIVWDAASKKTRRHELLSGDLALIYSLAVGDLDANGLPEIVAGGGNGRIIVLRSARTADGALRFDVENSPELGDFPYSGCISYHVAAVDVDGEAGDEIIASFASDRCLGNGRIEAWKVRPRSSEAASSVEANNSTEGSVDAPAAQPAAAEPAASPSSPPSP